VPALRVYPRAGSPSAVLFVVVDPDSTGARGIPVYTLSPEGLGFGLTLSMPVMALMGDVSFLLSRSLSAENRCKVGHAERTAVLAT
jgi:hypothetical protein